jgi:hypothetical protein
MAASATNHTVDAGPRRTKCGPLTQKIEKPGQIQNYSENQWGVSKRMEKRICHAPGIPNFFRTTCDVYREATVNCTRCPSIDINSRGPRIGREDSARRETFPKSSATDGKERFGCCNPRSCSTYASIRQATRKSPFPRQRRRRANLWLCSTLGLSPMNPACRFCSLLCLHDRRNLAGHLVAHSHFAIFLAFLGVADRCRGV